MSLDSQTTPFTPPITTNSLNVHGTTTSVFPKRSTVVPMVSAQSVDETHFYIIEVFLFTFNPDVEGHKLTIEFHKRSTAEELIEKILDTRAEIDNNFANCSKEDFELFDTMGTLDGRTYRERKMDPTEYPVIVKTLWPRGPLNVQENDPSIPRNRFVLKSKKRLSSDQSSLLLATASTIDTFLTKFLSQPKDREYADLCVLPELTEQTLLDNLRDRFKNGKIYTYIGPILVAVNPFNFLPIYNPKYSRLYCQNRRLGALPPHVFAIADVTYHNLIRNKENQVVVISGESGSGKTESTNFLLHHLTALSQKGTQGHTIEQQILSAGPVLEAFGNALTVQNNNSSRFGKFIRVNYRENGMVCGANVEIYLLEKSRIISQAAGERNYHVFYYLLEGMTDSERKDHLLLNAKDYYYLNQNSFFACESLNEKHEFERLKHAMTAVGFSTQSQQKIFGTISAVLLLGNIEYKKLRPGFHSDESAFIENEELVSIVSGMLCICAQQLTQALTMRRTVLKHDVVVNRYSLAEATQTRDALAKCLYNALFHWIVLRINHSLFRKESATANKANGLYIGILDIFGFEDVGGNCNSFEQLCINYANERLQAYFNQHIFQFEQEIYMKENIRWTPIQYTDNTECVQMFSSKPYGLLRLVDEESNINNGTDQSMLEKLNTFLKTNEYYEVPHKREAAFIIAHYAGKVKYQISGFREKNKDLMRHDVMNVLKGSKSAFVRELVGEDPVAVFRWSLLRTTVRAMFAFRQAGKTKLRAGSVDRLELSTAQTPSMARRSSDSHLNAFLRGELPASIVPDFCDISVFKTIKERARKTPTKSHSLRLSYLRTLQALKGAVGQKAISNKPSSVSRQFGESLSRLMKTLGQATPYFIRCIKSNNEKVPNHFDDNIILRQLRYTGMLETVRIRRAGYSVRIEYESFVNQYRILLPKGLASSKNDIQEFMRCIPIIDSEENIQYGNTKIFMRDPEKLLLDDHLHRVIMEKILTLQRWIRAQLEHKRFKKFRQGVIKLQALTRGVLARIKMQRKHAAVICIQSWWRKVVAQRKYKMIRLTVVGIQSFARGNAQRKCLEELRSSKENMSRVSPRPMITRLTKTTLPKLDLNDPESLAAFASPDSFDSRDLDDELLLSIGEEEETDEDEEDEGEDGERLEEEMFELDDEKLAKHKREHPELALDADFILEDARLKLIQSHSYEAKRKMMQRRQSLAATTASARKHKMLRRAASTESDQIQDSTSKNKIPSSISKVCPKAKSSFLKATKQLKALLKKAGRQGAVDVGEGTHFEFDVIHSSSTRSSSKECDKLRFHQFKPSRVCKTDKCALCNRQMTGILMIQGLRCFGCKLIFHKDCANFASKIPCTTPLTSPNPIYKMSEAGRRPWDRMSFKSPRLSLASTYHGPLFGGTAFTAIPSFNLTKTKQQTDSTALLIESIDDLREFSVFIFKKQSHLGQQNKRETVVDAIFKRALREFHMELIGMEATLQKGSTTLKYHDLIRTFEGLLTKICNEEKLTFPTTLGVNAFRGFLNEFMEQRKRRSSSKKSSIIKTVKKKRRRSDITIHNGHQFSLDYVHIPTYCEICNVFMWHAERIFVCFACRLSCHKKCHSRVNYGCPKANSDQPTCSKFFGTDLANLLADDEVPALLNRLLNCVEVKALFVEGIYRKSGQMAVFKGIRKKIETIKEPEAINFDEIPIHVLTSLIKAFFRELSEPLIIPDLYENFVNISEIKETNERIRCLRAMMDMLPKGNKCVLDRLMYHLARVAHQESVNKMSASNLAVIFAPCIVRRNTTVHAQEQLMDVQKQAICVQTLIEDKLHHLQETLSQIVELEGATEKVTENLRRIEEHRRASTGTMLPTLSSGDSTINEKIENNNLIKPKISTTTKIISTNLNNNEEENKNNLTVQEKEKNIETARQLFEEQLDFLDKEKAKLIQELPPLAPVASSEDLSSDDVDNSGGANNNEAKAANQQKQKKQESLRSENSREEYALDLTVPPVLALLNHACKLRPRKCKGMRRPSINFIKKWRNEFVNKG